MDPLRWFAVLDTKKLVLHQNSSDGYDLPPLYSGESPYASFTGLQRNPLGTAGRSPWVQVDPSSFGLKVGLYSGATQLGFQDTWANDLATYVKRAQWIYDSVAITAALGGLNQIPVTVEWEITPTAGGAFKIQSSTTLLKGLIGAASATVPAGEVAATQAWVKQITVPRDGVSDPNNPCDGFYIKSITGTRSFFVYLDDNKTWQITDA
jgi:hypothetical protein